MDIENLLKEQIVKSFDAIFDIDLSKDEIHLQPTRKEFEGSHTFVTFPYGKATRKSPEETGKLLGAFLKENSPEVQDFNVVKGFLNIVVADETCMAVLSAIKENPEHGELPANGKSVVVEYSSPNTNKPLHLGHLRNNFLGYSISEILKAAGYTVTRVNLVNDRGIHICKSMLAYQKWGKGETPASSGIKGDHLIGNYYVKFDKEYKKEIEALVKAGMDEDIAKKKAPLMRSAQEMLKKWEEGDQEVVGLWKQMNDWVYEGFEVTYKNMGIDFDAYLYESNTYILGKDIVEEGLEKKVFFKKDNGSVWADLSDEGLDQKLVLRSDGTSVYMTQDLGTADLKYQHYHFDKSIYVVGNEQDYHFVVLFKILRKLGRPYAEGLYHLSYGMVDLPTGKMKSREGTVVDADELMREMVDTAKKHTIELGKIEDFSQDQANDLYHILGLGALKYFLLKVDPKKRMLFDPQESIEFQGHTGPFIQYTYARIAAIVRKGHQLEIEPDQIDPKGISSLHPIEKTLTLLLHEFPSKVKAAADDFSPSVITQYAYDLAKEYNRFYAEVSIFNVADPKAMEFRILLSFLVARTLKKAMKLLGIDVPDRM